MFSVTQLRQISKAVLLVPQDVAQAISEKEFAQVAQVQELERDNANKVFYDIEIANLSGYFAEAKALFGRQYASYSESDLISGAKQSPGCAHYPTSPPWMALKPKVLDSNNGHPISNISEHEGTALNEVAQLLDFLVSGFTGSASDSLLAEDYIGGTIVSTNDDLPAGSLFLAYSAVGVLFGRALSSTSTPPSGGSGGGGSTSYSVNIEILSRVGTIASGSPVLINWPGISNASRESNGAPYQAVFAHLKDRLAEEIGPWTAFIQTQVTALNQIAAFGSEGDEIVDALQSNSTALSRIANWLGVQETGSGGRYTDAGLSDLLALIDDRYDWIFDRKNIIETRLGSVAQGTDGNFSGSGHFYSLFKWIDFRAGKGGGTLVSFYGAQMLIDFAETKVQTALSKKQEFENSMVVQKITEVEDGSDEISVETSTGLAVGDQVIIIDEQIASPTAEIISIAGARIQLNIALSGFELANLPRIVKPL